jgi:2-polyprenyl-3-methyl-5-hydroxy-6-metoxy-1,4-benzoquinol methylase
MQEESQILRSWHVNAKAWIDAIAGNSIESRVLVTNQAILDEVSSMNPRTVLDLGCGEGWFCGALLQKVPGCRITGVDGIPELIHAAAIRYPGVQFLTCTYQAINNGEFTPPHRFDTIAINFALFGDELVVDLLDRIRGFIAPGGSLVIQTLHPYTACGDQPYVDGWRAGSWNGFSEDFTEAAPWYFRTMGGWIRLFAQTGYAVRRMLEPVHPQSKMPLSVIFILEAVKD